MAVKMQSLREWDAAEARSIAAGLKHMDGPLLPILHALNDRFGHINNDAIVIVADVLNLTRAEVQGVVGFYHDFRRNPAGHHIVKLCRANPSQSLGAEQIAARLKKALGIGFGETTKNGRVTLEAVYCLGNCARSPAALVDGELYGRITDKKILSLVGL